ncbi:uncharacterized protein LY89DRAFT_777032 [Mollisia scopiformis]|uniref:Nucleoporin NUP53 n=1 Tax=Mollisia scopiformis TaxID=149040 RepID=A0A194XSX2_MOLSC|nr:uncharacterized protein LY89DRAFT_777032 [Mollisia scopiformis]KUJ23241.1 hypothetical protein LY89DRAFT_777032 [Mollisia scopiformis]
MPPLILHNVPDEELYVGEDGVQRPYAMLFPSNDGNPSLARARRVVPETGSFGKSTRRSRSRTGTPAAKREDPTIAAGDAIFSQFFAQKSAEASELPQRRGSVSASMSQPNLSLNAPLAQIDGNAGTSSRFTKEPHKEPTEVILRGFLSTQQYAAIREFERIGGRICEDYPRDPPIEQRRFKADLRDPAALRRKPMTVEEKAKALKFAGGEHWIKVTFESAEAAEIAIESSPQTILGHLVYAELYRGVPPTQDEAIPTVGKTRTPKKTAQSLGTASGFNTQQATRTSSTLPRSFATPSMREVGRGSSSISPPESQTSSHTLDTATMASTSSSATMTGTAQNSEELLFCRRIPTAKRIQLLPAEQALLPQESFSKRVMSKIPLVSWFSTDIIGSAVPRTDQGEFDWAKATLYWKLVWMIDSCTGWFDVFGNDKED